MKNLNTYKVTMRVGVQTVKNGVYNFKIKRVIDEIKAISIAEASKKAVLKNEKNKNYQFGDIIKVERIKGEL